jgi:hypothetical protein
MSFKRLGLSVVMVVVLAAVGWGAPQQAPATAAPGNHLVTFTGVLKDAEGRALAGAVTMKFLLYAAQEGGEALWVEQQAVVADADGRYSVLLGAVTVGGLPAEVFGDGKAQWLAAQVVGQAEPARVLLVAVPYAMKAADAETLGGKTVTSFVLTENLAKAIQEQVATGTVSGSTTTSSIGGVVQFGHETDDNTWFGMGAGSVPPSGSGNYNAFFGAYAGHLDSTGCCNAFLGRSAGYYNTTGQDNVFVGNQAGYFNVTSDNNTFVGRSAGFSNTASQNTFVGSNAGYSTVGSGNNTFVGFWAGKDNTAGQNTFVGAGAGQSNTSGGEGVYMGYQAGAANLTGSGGTLIGYQAGKVVTANYNTMIGSLAGQATTAGIGNTMVGRRAGQGNTTGDYSVYLGYSAGDTNDTGNAGTYIGTYSDGTAGLTNAGAIGYRAYVTQSNSLVLGSINGTNGASTNTNVGIGTTAPAARFHVGAGEVRLANGNGTSTHFNYLNTSINYVRGITYFDGASAYFTGGNIGVGTSSPVAKLHVSGGEFRLMNGSGEHTHLNYGNLSTNYIRGVTYFDTAAVYFTGGNVGIGTTTPSYKLHVVGDIYTTGTYQGSDLRLKRNVQNLGYGLREVMRLRPVSYEWKDRPTGPATFGLIAQEVATIMPELVGKSQDEAGMLSLNYVGLVPVLVKAVQEQEPKFGQLKAETTDLRTEMTAETAALKARIAELEAQIAQLRALIQPQSGPEKQR